MLLFVGFLNFFIFIIYVITAINLTDGWCKYSTCFDRSSSKNKGKVNISLWLDNYSEIDYLFIFSKYLLQAFWKNRHTNPSSGVMPILQNNIDKITLDPNRMTKS